MRPETGTYPQYFDHYIALVEENEVQSALKNNTDEFLKFLDSLPAEKAEFAYAKDKWTLKEVLLHITDAERIFAYRALRFSRNDTTPLPSFDENEFIEFANSGKRSLQSVIDEFKTVRSATLSLFNSLDNDELTRKGIGSSQTCTALAMGFIIAGHTKHHIKVIKENYL
ncbi:damage-inducible protein DinB [Solitalea longa]|uniref:Damage-inducible protein DinB n=1 Tax=Solitalea longa TaxID=2079460 RepID=A0A2S4ZWQ5_9SPHI|nr:DinB family protein [Solitalea longa]POY34804.1 damage-inducible protein DinB [Solitalea longa]